MKVVILLKITVLLKVYNLEESSGTDLAEIEYYTHQVLFNLSIIP